MTALPPARLVPAISVGVGICTFRRPHLAATLTSVARQDLPPGVQLHILVADNDDLPSASGIVRDFAAGHRVAVTHLHCPAANISIARNAVLDAAERFGLRHLAFLDDDEVASPGWLAALWQRHGSDGAEVTLGPVQALYRADAPRWMVAARLHDTAPDWAADGTPSMGYTCNVLLDLAAPALRDLRFDLARGRTGGEDTAYFHTARKAGARFAYAPAALVVEEVPAARARLGWLVQRRYRMGQTHAGLAAPARLPRRMLRAALALAKVAGAALLALPRLGTAQGRARALMRMALHCGVLGAQFGAPEVEPYGSRSPVTAPPHPAAFPRPEGRNT